MSKASRERFAGETIETLMEQAKTLPAPTEREKQATALDFAYGNLACTNNHKPQLMAFFQTARNRWGWTWQEFKVWADGREWSR